MLYDIRWQNTRFVQSVASPIQFPVTHLPQVAVAGHSNVGKSSLLNALFGRRNLVKTSKSPGCTRLLNLFDVDDKILIVDLPGYGFARAPKKEQARWAALIEGYLTHPPGPGLVLMLLDIRHGPKDSDLQLIDWLNAEGLRWQPVATKSDKLTGNKRTRRLYEMKQALGGLLAPMPASALDNRGIEALRDLIAAEL
jgi:GTP-binding protein